MINEVLADLSSEMASTQESFKRDLSRIRTGRVNPALPHLSLTAPHLHVTFHD